MVVEAFHFLEEFMATKLEFTVDSYLEGFPDCKAKVKCLFPDINLSLLDTDKEGASVKEGIGSGGAEDMPIEDAGVGPQPSLVIVLSELDIPAKKSDSPIDA